MRPLPLIALGRGDNAVFNLIAKVEVQDVHAGIEGLIAVVQRGGNGEVSANVSLFRTGVLDGDHLVHIVLSGRHAERILLALRRADDRVELLILLEGFELRGLVAGRIQLALLLKQLDLDPW